MGYYVKYEGTITIPAERREDILDALKNLNYRHDLKQGGAYGAGVSDDPFESRWFSWMPSRYHEEVESVEDVLLLLGFEGVDGQADEHLVHYDNKSGDEMLFLEALVKAGGEVSLEYENEDGDHAIVESVGGRLRLRSGAAVHYDWRLLL